MTAPVSWEGLRGALPAHQDEIMTAHGCVPSMAVQDQTHGAPRPLPDHGTGDREKLR